MLRFKAKEVSCHGANQSKVVFEIVEVYIPNANLYIYISYAFWLNLFTVEILYKPNFAHKISDNRHL